MFKATLSTKLNEVHQEIRKAASVGNISFIKEKMKDAPQNGIDINHCGPTTGKSALHQAVIHKQYEVVEYLTTLSNLVCSPDKNKKTPVEYAFELGDRLIARLLIRRFPGERIEQRIPESDLVYRLGIDFYHQMHKSLITSKSTAEIIALSKIIPPGYRYMGYTLLHYVAQFTNDFDAIYELIKLGEDPNQQVSAFQYLSFCNTSLHNYLANESIEESMRFIDIVIKSGKKLDFKLQDDEGKTALLLAAKIRQSRCVHFLLERGAEDSIFICDANKRNILHVICIMGDIDSFHLIQKIGCFSVLLEQQDSGGKKPKDLLTLSQSETESFIKSIYIDPTRDLNAPSNTAPPCDYKPAGKTFLQACMEGRKEIEAELQLVDFSKLSMKM